MRKKQAVRLLLLSLLASPGLALDLSQQQQSLYADGEKAAKAGDWETAGRNFRAVLALGPNNMAWLSLGEALTELGQCTEGAEALDKVATAPELESAPREFADAMAAAQRKRLAERCPGRLIVRCTPPLTHFRLEGKETPCGQTLVLNPGKRTISAGDTERPMRVQIRVFGLEDTEVELSLPAPPPSVVTVQPEPPPPPPTGWGPWETTGWVLTGTGAAVLAAAVVLNVGPTRSAYDTAQTSLDALEETQTQESHDRAVKDVETLDTLQTWTLVSYIVGGVLAASGTTLLLIDPDAGTAGVAFRF